MTGRAKIITRLLLLGRARRDPQVNRLLNDDQRALLMLADAVLSFTSKVKIDTLDEEQLALVRELREAVQ